MRSVIFALLASAVVSPNAVAASLPNERPELRVERMDARTHPAQGSERGAIHMSTFMQLDGDRDGYISREEAKHSGALSVRFALLDTDGDNRISAQELDVSSESSASVRSDRQRN